MARGRRTFDPLIELPPLPRSTPASRAAKAEGKVVPAPPRAKAAAPAATPSPAADDDPEDAALERALAEAEKRPDPRDELAKRHRTAIRRGRAALTALAQAFRELGVGEEALVSGHLADLGTRLDSLQPPPPRTCKEFRRARALARQGMMGIHPDDVVRYCPCVECHGLRESLGLPHPLAPRGVAE
jgi:hypothetical protein